MSTTIARRVSEVSRYQPDDRPSLEGLYAQTFGAGTLQADPAYFRWVYEANPQREAAGPQLWVCRRPEGVVGQQGGIPFPLKVGERWPAASWAVDLMVAPEWRLRGVGPALTDTHVNANEVVGALGISDAAYKAYRRSGWIDLSPVPLYLRVVDAARCAKVGPIRNPWIGPAAAAANPLLRGAAMAFRGLARLAGTRLDEVAAFDSRVDALWPTVAPVYPVIARRDHTSLSWRFDAVPGAARYRRFLLIRRGVVKGYLVLRVDPWRGEPVGVVIDYLARPEWLGPLFAHAVDLAHREGLIAVMCRTLNAPGRNVLMAMGFLYLKTGIRRPLRFMARLGPTAADLAPLVSDPKNWFLTAGDSDIGLKELSE